MKVNLSDALFYSKQIIKNGDYYSGIKFREYSKSFVGASENINFCLEKERYRREKALTVLAGGDHVFNLIFQGFKQIDAFDINKLQYFVYELRKAMIQVLSYKEYLYANLRFDCCCIDYLLEILEKAKAYLDEDIYEYYQRILDFAKKTGRLENLYYMVIGDFWKKYNNYLVSEEAYLLLRKKMNDASINIYFGDVLDVSDNLVSGYDLILLSNISDYLGKIQKPLTLEEFNNFIDNFYKLLNDGGTIINYVYGFYDDFLFKNSIITESDIPKSNLVRIEESNHGYYRVRKVV